MGISGNKLVIFSPLLHHDADSKSFGGIHPWVINFANGLSELGYDVSLILSTRKSTPLSIPGLSPEVALDRVGFHALFALVGLFRYFRKNHVDITITAGYRYNKLIGWVSRYVSTGSWIVSIHENLTEALKSLRSKKARKRLKEIEAYKKAQGVITVSEGLKDDLVNNYGFEGDLVKVIYNPLVKPDIDELAMKPVSHQWFQDKIDNIIIGIGRLENQKNWPLLISTFSKFVEQRDARLIILGEGKNRSRLEDQIRQLHLEDKVSLPGFVDNPYSYIARSRCLVMSSDWEGFGNVLVEAMAVGKPVVSTNCPSGPGEILEWGKWGELVPMNDEDRLLEALNKTWANPVASELLKDRAKEFSVSKQVHELNDYLQKFI